MVYETVAHRLPNASVGAKMVPGSSASVAARTASTRSLQAPFPYASDKVMGDAFNIIADSSMIRPANAMHWVVYVSAGRLHERPPSVARFGGAGRPSILQNKHRHGHGVRHGDLVVRAQEWIRNIENALIVVQWDNAWTPFARTWHRVRRAWSITHGHSASHVQVRLCGR
jgi:hypothetical protein